MATLRDTLSTVKAGVFTSSARLGRVPKLWNATIVSHRAAVRDAILDAARDLVAERGLRALTMADIAARASIGRATIYKYFGDADSIIRAWHDREISGHLAELAAIKQAPGDAESRLAAVLGRYATIAGRRGGHDAELSAVLHHDEQVARARHGLRQLLAELLAEAAVAGVVRDDMAPDELAAFCLHALGAAGDLSSRRAVRRLVAVTLAALRP